MELTYEQVAPIIDCARRRVWPLLSPLDRMVVEAIAERANREGRVECGATGLKILTTVQQAFPTDPRVQGFAEIANDAKARGETP